jgi:hypothetical protein
LIFLTRPVSVVTPSLLAPVSVVAAE